jgi:cytochrome b
MAIHFRYKKLFHWKVIKLLFWIFFMSTWNENVHLALGVSVFYDLKMIILKSCDIPWKNDCAKSNLSIIDPMRFWFNVVW